MKMRRGWFLFGAVPIAFVLSSQIPARAAVPSKLEPDYAEAVLAFHAKDYGRSIRLLNELLAQAPAVVEAMELKALVQKSSQDDAAAYKTYRDLIDVKRKQGASAK